MINKKSVLQFYDVLRRFTDKRIKLVLQFYPPFKGVKRKTIKRDVT